VRPTTLAGYRVHVRRCLVPLLGRLSLVTPDAAGVQRLHAELLARDPLPATVQRVHVGQREYATRRSREP
jgi:hypothetical protein